MKKIILFLLFVIPICASAQNRGNVWCFGDSAGIDFNSGSATPIVTGIDTRGSSVSIADSIGNLLFYAQTRAGFVGKSTQVFNHNNVLMQNGDTIVGGGWYKELLIIPKIDNLSLYYLFSVGVTSNVFPGFYYSIIDMSQNGGLGEVIQKNIQLENFKVVDGISAIKHGNGRDYWIAIKNALSTGNEHYIYLVNQNGISAANIQSIGSNNNTNAGRYAFSKDGNKLAFVNYIGLLEIYEFDRCTGLLSNPLTIHPEPTGSSFRNFWSCEFSPNGNILYVTSITDTSYLYQYDLLSANISGSRVVLDTITNSQIGNSFLKLGPDGKIYLSSAWECYAFPTCYPYPDSVYNFVNMNLGLINNPDSLGIGCNYSPFSFYLGGKRTYYGLPNNPDYDMGPLTGSPCDTIVGIQEPAAATAAELFVYYAPDWQTAFINANKLKGTQYHLEVFDLMGKSIFRESGKISPPYFTKNLSCGGYAKGMYVVNFITDKEKISRKFVVQ